jgi:hypothetical protein
MSELSYRLCTEAELPLLGGIGSTKRRTAVASS